MKKLLTKILLLAFIVFTLAVSLSLGYNKYQYSENEMYKNMPNNIKIANTGSSHGVYGFNYSNVNYPTFNFALDSQSIVYDYQLIDYYIDHFEKGAVLLIPISYFTFWSDEFDDEMFDSKNSRYFSILDKEHMRFKTEKDYYLNQYLSILYVADKHVKTVFAEDRRVKNPQTGEFTIEDVGKLRAGFHLESIEIDGKLKQMNEENLKALEMLIQVCKEHQVEPILVTTPYLNYYSKWFDKEMKEIFHHEIDRYIEKYNVIYWDYSEDDRFANDEKLFKDTDHLNEEGAKKFTEIVVNDLKKYNKL